MSTENRNGCPSKCTAENIGIIWNVIGGNPKASISVIGLQTNLLSDTCQVILKENTL